MQIYGAQVITWLQSLNYQKVIADIRGKLTDELILLHCYTSVVFNSVLCCHPVGIFELSSFGYKYLMFNE